MYVVSIGIVPFDDFDFFKKFTEAKGVRDYYWVYTDDEDDLYQPWKPKEERIAEPAMLAAYPDGELCEPDVDQLADVIPIIYLFAEDEKEREHIHTIGNMIRFANIEWTICRHGVAIANETIGQCMFNPKEKGSKYESSTVHRFILMWLDSHRKDTIFMIKE